MTKPLDAEIKALRALVRSLETLDTETRLRVLRYLWQRYGYGTVPR